MTHLPTHVVVVALVAMVGPHDCSATATSQPAQRVDFRYAPTYWETCIGLPDDWQKTIVGSDGALLYDYPGPHTRFRTKISLGMPTPIQWVRQELVSPRVPIVRTPSGFAPF